ncbi:MAG: hypothetical protein QM739_20545 [Propionivibrio sp.]
MTLANLGALLGVLGFLMSCVNLWRSIKATKETRSLAFAQKKQEALSLVIDGEVGTMAARRQLWEIRDDAKEIGASRLVADTENFIKDYERSLAQLSAVRAELETQVSGQMNHADHLKFIETTMAKVKQITDPKKIAEEVAVFVDPARRHIAARRKIKGTEADDVT